MAEQIKNNTKSIEELKTSLKDYIEEDRGWKKELKESLDNKYARKSEVDELRRWLLSFFGVLTATLLGICGYLIANYVI
ncbi:MAG: hypothetical protein ACOCTT_03080 [archaeon]